MTALGHFHPQAWPADHWPVRHWPAPAGSIGIGHWPDGHWPTGHWWEAAWRAVVLPGIVVYRAESPDEDGVVVAELGIAATALVVTGDPSSEAWFYLRAISCCGVLDVEPIRRRRVAFDAAGNLILPVPHAPIGLELTQSAAGVTASWMYVTNGQATPPAEFRIYTNTNDAGWTFDTPAATVPYSASQSFSSDLGNSWSHDDELAVIVRTVGAAGVGEEEPNTDDVTITIDKLAPDAPATVSVEVIAS